VSIYATWLTIEDERQWMASMSAAGINAGVIRDGDPMPEDFDAPIVYQGSHVLPSDTARRGGGIDVAAIPDHITRDGRDDAPEGALKDWLRLSVDSEDSDERYDGRVYVPGGRAVVVLTRPQVERLRDTLTEWLDREATA
jgi:hypothetical protein